MPINSRYGCLKKDESGIWHYESDRDVAIEVAATDAIRLRRGRVIMFWHDGFPTMVKRTDSPHSLTARHKT